MRISNAQKGGERWIIFIQTFSDFCFEHYQLPLPVIYFKNDQYRLRPSRDKLENAAPNSNVSQKSTNSRVQQSMFMSQYALFISFPVRHTVNFQFDGRHCIGDLMAHTIIRKLLYSEFDRKGSIKPKFQKKAFNFSDKTNQKNSFLLEFFIWNFWFPIDIFVNGKIEIHLK